MFLNYFKTAWRYILKNKTTSIINILGLSIGISAALIIFIVVQYDRSFDTYEPNKERIFRIVSDGDTWKNPGVPAPLHKEVIQKITGIETTAPIFQYNDWNAKVKIPQGNNIPPQVFKKQEDIVFIDSNYFRIFPHEWIAGNEKTSLKHPYNLVLSESRAALYFPGIEPQLLIGKTVIFSDTLVTTISGIVKDLKYNSDFENKAYLSLATLSVTNLKQTYNWEQWGSTNSNTLLLVKLLPNVLPQQINTQLAAIFNEHSKETGDSKTNHRLQPLSDVHTNIDYEGTVNPATIKYLIILALFLLLLGAINFINLSTAHAAERAKEIGIRKTLGSKKSQLIGQFLSETFLLTFFTTLLSLAITPLLIHAFTGFIPEGLQINYIFTNPSVFVFLFILIVTVSIVSGLYPAFILSKFKPVNTLKNTTINASGINRNSLLRKSLIVFQFVIAQVFIIGVMVVNKQIDYSLKKNMGFRKEAILNFYVPFDFQNPNNKKFVLRDELKQIPGIQKVSLGNQAPAVNGQMSTEISYREKSGEKKFNVDCRNGDTSYIGVYNIRLLAGRNILASDTANELLINETLAKQLGFNNPADAVGHFISLGASLPIVGVMRDFNLASVKRVIHPLIYYAAPKFGYVMHIALEPNPSTWESTIKKMELLWKNIYPNDDFDYVFLDKKVNDFYKEEMQLSKLLTWSSVVSFFISCMGLLGLVIFMTNKRKKEIGVRKILGATVYQIITLFSIDFVKLLLMAFLIAIPIAWWLMHNWLQNFAYHTNLSWWIFLMSGIIMITIALLIICLQAGKSASSNPVESLRTE